MFQERQENMTNKSVLSSRMSYCFEFPEFLNSGGDCLSFEYIRRFFYLFQW